MILYDTKYLQLKSTKSKTGKDWVYAHRPNAKDVVVILPLINNKDILFLKEERPPLQAENIAKYSIALPAGLVGDERIGETVEDAIHAELLEENNHTLDFDVFTCLTRSKWTDIKESSNFSIVLPNRTKEEIKDEIPIDSIERCIRKIVDGLSSSKSDFMYSIIIAGKQYSVMPNYIKEGLKCLAKK